MSSTPIITPCPASPRNRSPERWRNRWTLTSSAPRCWPGRPRTPGRTDGDTAGQWHANRTRARASSRSVKPIGRSAAAASMRRTTGSAASAGSASRGCARTRSRRRGRQCARPRAAAPPRRRARAGRARRPAAGRRGLARTRRSRQDSRAEGGASSGAALPGAVRGAAAGAGEGPGGERAQREAQGGVEALCLLGERVPGGEQERGHKAGRSAQAVGHEERSGLPGIEAERQVVGGAAVDRLHRPGRAGRASPRPGRRRGRHRGWRRAARGRRPVAAGHRRAGPAPGRGNDRA